MRRPAPANGWVMTLVPRPWLSICGFIMAATILAGGPKRFSGEAFSTPRSMAPWWVWGAGFAVVGLAQLVPYPSHIEWVVRFIAALPYTLLAVGLAFSAMKNQWVALTGIGIYGWTAAVHLRIAAIKRVDARLGEDTYRGP